MSLPPIKFEPPITSEPGEPREAPLTRLKWVWLALAIVFSILISNGISASSARNPIKDSLDKVNEKALEMQLCMKSMAPGASTSERDLFKQQVSDLLESSRKSHASQRLRIVLRKEDGEQPFKEDIKNLAKSKNAEDNAFAKLYDDPKPTKAESLELLKQVKGNGIAEKLAQVQVKESLGDKTIRSKMFDPTKVLGIAFLMTAGLFGFLVGMGLLLYYYSQRVQGKLIPKGLAMSNLDWGKAERLVFCGLIIIGSYFGASILELNLHLRATGADLLLYLPVFVAIVGCLSLPIFGWRITPRNFGLSFDESGRKVGWAFAAFFANIPILVAVVIVTSLVARYLPGGNHPVSEELLNNPKPMELLNIFILACVVAPIWEEVLFRGLLFPALTKALGKPIYGALVSSFMFAAIHPQGVVGILPLMAVAMMLCAVTYQTKSVVPNIILHGLHNAATLAFALTMGPWLK